MGIFRTEPAYDRSHILEAASRARARKRYRKAAALYRRVLAVEPSNVELHARLAPLLAATGNAFDAWTSYRACARAALVEKRLEQAATIYREAARCLPREIAAWEELASTERKRGRDKEAVEALLEGRRRFAGRRFRPHAISLLRRAREIDPASAEIAIDLARLLARSGQESEAQLLLDKLAPQTAGRDLRRVRGAQWRIAPTVGNTWRWIHAAATSGREPENGRRSRIHA